MDLVTLSRIQFGLTIAFHFLFPPLTIGLGVVLVVLQALRLATGKPVYTELARFWTRVFGLIFAVGVATGIPMEFQFGTNWARYARFVGDIFGSPLAIEGLYAFFLESGFLALLLFGWNRIGPRMHFVATLLVVLGAHFSAIWILVANSWMQTPAGYHLARRVRDAAGAFQEVRLPAGYVVQPADLPDVRAVVDDIGAAILNPSILDRLAHTVFACWMAGSLLVAGVAAWWVLRGRHGESARVALRVALSVAAVASLLQMVSGDATARGVSRNQPTKLAALEGLATSRAEASLGIAGWASWTRDADGRITGIDTRALRVPGLLSVLVSGDVLHPAAAAQTVVPGLAQLPSDDFLRRRHPGTTDAELTALRPRYWPNVPVLFQTYHIMVALGVLLTAIVLAGWWWAHTGRLFDTTSSVARGLLWLLVASPVLAQLAIQAGWFTAELGRQPWVVYEVLPTAAGTSAVVRAPQVLVSLVVFTLIYLLLGGLFLSSLRRLVHEGPAREAAAPAPPDGWRSLARKTRRQTRT